MCSDRRTRLAAVFLSIGLATAQARELISPENALRAAFSGCELERAPVHLDAELRGRVARRAGSPDAPGIAFRWIARRDGLCVGSAWFDTHRVRALRETLLVAIDAEGRLLDVIVVAFGEPPDYLPRRQFYAQFRGRLLDDDLDLGHGIDGVSGATLTSRATTRAARRALALDAELRSSKDAAPELWSVALIEAAIAARSAAAKLMQQRGKPAAARPVSFVLDDARLQQWQTQTDGTARDGIVAAFASGDANQPSAYIDTALDEGRPVALLLLLERGDTSEPSVDPVVEMITLAATDAPSVAARDRARRRCVALDRLLAAPAESKR